MKTLCLLLLVGCCVGSFSGDDVHNMRVRDLKRILRARDEPCQGCIERSDYVAKVEEILRKESPEAQLQAELRWKQKEIQREAKLLEAALEKSQREGAIRDAFRSKKAAKKANQVAGQLLADQQNKPVKEIGTVEGNNLQAPLLSAYRAVQDALSEFSVPNEELRSMLRSTMRNE